MLKIMPNAIRSSSGITFQSRNVMEVYKVIFTGMIAHSRADIPEDDANYFQSVYNKKKCFFY